MIQKYNNKSYLMQDNKTDPEDHKEINLFIFCLYLIAFGLLGNLMLLLYQNF